jgi:hypothetical protein
MKRLTAKEVIELLDLEPLEGEGGFFRFLHACTDGQGLRSAGRSGICDRRQLFFASLAADRRNMVPLSGQIRWTSCCSIRKGRSATAHRNGSGWKQLPVRWFPVDVAGNQAGRGRWVRRSGRRR